MATPLSNSRRTAEGKWPNPNDFHLAGDDSLDVVGVHVIGGIVGTVLIGLFANATRGADGRDLVDGGLRTAW